MSKPFCIFALLVFCAVLTPAFAGSVSHTSVIPLSTDMTGFTDTDEIPLMTTMWTEPVTFPQFDPSMGQLLGIEFRLYGRIEGSIQYESLDAAPALLTINYSGAIEMELPTPGTLLTSLPSVDFPNIPVTAFDGSVDFAGTSGGMIEDVEAEDTVMFTSMPPTPEDLAVFLGTGTVDLIVSANGTSMGTGPGNLILGFFTLAAAEVEVTYLFLCDDGDPCTTDEELAGECVFTPIDCSDGVICTVDSCDPSTGTCDHEPDDLVCDDGNACTDDICDPDAGGSPSSSERGDCDFDGDIDLVDFSSVQLCFSGTAQAGPNCGCADFDADGDVDLVDFSEFQLAFTGSGVSGSSDDVSGCVYEPIVCDDGDPCTDDSCDPDTGCVFEPVICDDGNPCTDEFCDPVDGCMSDPVDVDDSVDCTIDSCDPITGDIRHDPDDGACDDGDACTTDTCDPVDGCLNTPVDVDDGVDCTIDECDPVTGDVTHTPDDNACDDGDACTTDTCDPVDGCLNTPVDIDDGVVCTIDECDPITGDVTHTPDDSACDDGNECTIDSCDPDSGCENEPIDVDDGVDCTTDDCDPATGDVTHTPDDNACDDGDPCTTDTCDPFNGCMYTPVDVDDGIECTIDSCDPATGDIRHEPNDAACDDGDSCTTDDCDPATGCVNTPIDCDDGDDCTEDMCINGMCANVPIDCDDGDSCTADECINGECVSTPIVCDDDDPCTDDECVDGMCVCMPIDCSDGNPCTDDSCVNGECVHSPIMCDDGDDCTSDMCINGECVSTPIDCDDGDACTEDFCEQVDDCIDGPIMTMSHTDTIPSMTTNWMTVVTIPQFNPLLGDLLSIEYRVTGGITGSVAFESLDASGGQISVDFSGDIVLELPAGAGLIEASPVFMVTEPVTAFDGVIDFDGPSGSTFSPISADAFTIQMSNPPTAGEAAAFTGLGFIDLQISAIGTSGVSGPGNLIAQIIQQAGATVQVIYTYRQCDTVGGCVHEPIDCDDMDPCTDDTCDPDMGCVNTPIDCDDMDPCTIDECIDGECVNTPIDCDDTDPCTTDECIDGECVNTPIDCDDMDPCTIDECIDGECVNTPIDCDDGDPCTTDECIDGECVNTPIVCDDGDECTSDECVDGECVYTPGSCTPDGDTTPPEITCPPDIDCTDCEEVVIDFETDGFGVAFQAGQIIDGSLPGLGVTVTTNNFASGHPDLAIIFDSANPTGGDSDLLTPGPHPTNNTAQGLVLVIAENDHDGDGDGLVDNPDDEAARPAGWIRFVFDNEYVAAEVDLLDIEEEETVGVVDFYLDGLLIGSESMAGLGCNSFQTLSFDGGSFNEIKVRMPGSGAIPGLRLTPDCECEPGEPELTDNCDPDPTVTFEDTPGECETVVTRTWTATDACGNSSTCTQEIIFDPCVTVGCECCELDCPAAGTQRYRLGNHPDAELTIREYGLRLDELVDLTGGHDWFTFDFEHPDAAMYADVSDTTIHIYGVAYGGATDDPDYIGLWQVDFLYNDGVGQASGDDDIVVTSPNGSNFGIITMLFGDGETFPLEDFRGSHTYTFRLGDEDDDNGHRGYPGTSGWGWLNHNGLPHVAASDFIFIAFPTDECIGEGECPDDGSIDLTPPVIDCPDDVTVPCDGSTNPADTGMATATDECPDGAIVSYDDRIISGDDGMHHYSHVVAELGPMHHWRLGEGSGSPTADDSMGDLIGMYEGVTLGMTGAIMEDDDTAAGFSGDHVAFEHSSDLELSSGTISLCFKDTGAIETAGLFSKDSNGFDDGGHLTIYTEASRVKVRMQSTSNTYTIESPTISANQWYNLQFTFGSGGMKLYLDGEQVASHWYSGGLQGNQEPFAVGANTWSSGDHTLSGMDRYFGGDIDEVMIFDYQMSDDDVATLHAAVHGGHGGHGGGDPPAPEPTVIERTWIATDACGNTSTCIQTITVESCAPCGAECDPEGDTHDPWIDCPDDVTADCGWTEPSETGYASAWDTCDDDVEVTYEDEFTPGEGCGGTITRTWTATDDCGNDKTCTQTITVHDPSLGPDKVLLVVKNAWDLTYQEDARKDLIESWGYDVELIDHDASQSAFNAALSNVDVAYISETVSSSSVGNKLTNTSVGVVNEEGLLNDALKITSNDWGGYTDNDIDIIDGSHPITSAWSSGVEINIFDDSQEMKVASGSMASGAMVLAYRDDTSNAVVVAVEAGATLVDGSAAAGRRVALPIGNETSVSNFNDNGRELIRRSIEWAAGGAGGGGDGGGAAVTTFTESGDAGSYPGTAITPTGGAGALTLITGSTSSDDPADTYRIYIHDPAGFEAATDGAAMVGGSADFDTQLWLLDEDGMGILGNDDCPFGCPGYHSHLMNPSDDGTGMSIPGPGIYYLAISGYDRDPRNGGGRLFDQETYDEVSGPDGSGGGSPISSWTTNGDRGNYTIALTGASFVSE